MSSPDEAKRNPGRSIKLQCRSRISLRSIRATREIKEAERRQARISNPHLQVRLALKRSALAYRRSTAALAAANQRRRSASDALPGTRRTHDPEKWIPVFRKDHAQESNGGYPSPPVPVQRHSRRPVIVPAGRFPEAARERSVSLRPREPHLAPPPRAPPWRRPFERDSRQIVTQSETNVKGITRRETAPPICGNWPHSIATIVR